MKRWQLSAGLVASALLAALVAPMLFATDTLVTPTSPTPAVNSGQLRMQLDQSNRELTISLLAPTTPTQDQRTPVSLAIAVDASGSMHDHRKMRAAKDAAHNAVDALGPQDEIALVLFNDHAWPLIPLQRADDKQRLHRLIDDMLEGGGTNLHAGMEVAANQLIGAKGTKKLVVISDGDANVGVVDYRALQQVSHQLARNQNLAISTIGVGVDFDDQKLAAISDIAGGSYAYAAQSDTLTHLLLDELRSTQQVASLATSIELSLPDGLHIRRVTGAGLAPDRTITVGDMVSGERRLISVELSSAPSSYLIEATAQGRTTSGGSLHGKVRQQLVNQPADPQSEATARAETAYFLAAASEHLAQGDRQRASQLVIQASQRLQEHAVHSRDVALKQEADQLRVLAQEMGQAPSKRTIRVSRDRARRLMRNRP